MYPYLRTHRRLGLPEPCRVGVPAHSIGQDEGGLAHVSCFEGAMTSKGARLSRQSARQSLSFSAAQAPAPQRKMHHPKAQSPAAFSSFSPSPPPPLHFIDTCSHILVISTHLTHIHQARQHDRQPRDAQERQLPAGAYSFQLCGTNPNCRSRHHSQLPGVGRPWEQDAMVSTTMATTFTHQH